MSAPSTTSILAPRGRRFSLLECVFGVLVVLGHNVFHILPNDVPILFAFGWISLRWRNGGWKYAGLSRPHSWWKSVAFAIAAAAVLLLGSAFIVEPLSHRIWPDPSTFPPSSSQGHRAG